MFAILVLMALFTTFMTTPTVTAIYKPLRAVTSPTHRRLDQQSHTDKSRDEFRILACLHGPENVPSLINLAGLIRNPKLSPLKLYVMHLVELTDRSSSIVMLQKARRNGFSFINRVRRGMSNDQIVSAFGGYSQLGRTTIRHSKAISALHTMHEDIFHVAEEKRVSMIILPFHKQWRGEDEEAVYGVLQGWIDVNQVVLQSAPCSVAVLVDRGFGCKSETMAEATAAMSKSVCIVFFGGPDDRQSLELGGRMAEQAEFKLTLVRFIEEAGTKRNSFAEECPSDTCIQTDDSLSRNSITLKEKEFDEAAVEGFRRKWGESVVYEEKMMSNIKPELLWIGQRRNYVLVLVGKGSFPSNVEAKLSDNQVEDVGLGPIGNILASSDNSILSSVLVIQQYIADGNVKIISEKDAIDKIIHARIGEESCV